MSNKQQSYQDAMANPNTDIRTLRAGVVRSRSLNQRDQDGLIARNKYRRSNRTLRQFYEAMLVVCRLLSVNNYHDGPSANTTVSSELHDTSLDIGFPVTQLSRTLTADEITQPLEWLSQGAGLSRSTCITTTISLSYCSRRVVLAQKCKSLKLSFH